MTDRLFDEKYLVFKREEYEAWAKKEGLETTFAYPLPEPLDDAVVLRHQDLLCAPMLGLYRDMLTMILKIDEMGDAFSPENLQKVADWMDENAAEAADTGWKLPD